MPYYRRRRSGKVANRKTARKFTPRRARQMGRRYIRSRPRRKARAIRAKWANPVALQTRCKFHYADEGFNLPTLSVSGYINSHIFTGNSPYDPDVSGVGVQPYGWDDYCSQYHFSQFRAFASHIKVRFYSAEAFKNVVITLVPLRIYPPTYEDLNDLKAIPGAKQVYASSDTKGVFTMTHYWSTKRAVPYVNPTESTGSYSANPSRLWVWMVFVDSSTIAEELDMKFDVQIDYYTQLYKGNDANES